MRKTIIVAIGIVSLISCTDEPMHIKESYNTEKMMDIDSYVFPNSPTFKSSQSRSGSTFETDWENFMVYSLPDGRAISTPWSAEGVGANSGYHKDIKKEDGWIMVLHNLNKEGVIYNNKKCILLYNERTGYLKLFYYNDSPIAPTNKHYWQYSMSESNQALTNGVHPVSAPMDFRLNDNLKYNVNVGVENNGMLSPGWNMTEIPLVYDSKVSPDISLHITAYANTASDLSLYSQVLGTATGTIVSDVGNTPSQDSKKKILNFTDEKSKEIAKAIFPGENFIEKNLRKLISGGLQQLIKKPVNLFFDKFMGGFSQSAPTIQTINLTYQEKGQITGTITTPSRLDIAFNLPIGEKYTGVKLGAWNLSESPIVYIHPVGVICNVPNGDKSDENEYAFCASGKYKADVVFNPMLMSHIKMYRVECTPIFMIPTNWDESLLPDYPGDATAMGTLCDDNYGAVFHSSEQEELIGKSKIEGTDSSASAYRLIYTTKVCGHATYWRLWEKYGMPHEGDFPYRSQLYKYIYAPDNDDIIRGGKFSYRGTFYYLKVSLYAEMEFDGKVYNTLETRTYKPRFEWDAELISRYSGMSMSTLYHFGENDAVLQTLDKRILETSNNKF